MFGHRGRVIFPLTWQFLVLNGKDVSNFRHLSDYSSHESSKFMQKLLHKKGAKLKKKWYQSYVGQPQEMVGTLYKANKCGVTPSQRIRATQLSHVLYDRITQLINSGELSEEILNKQVLITAVRMHSNFEGINVYWDSNRTDAAEVEELLQDHARKLRSLLISYHVLGRIPPVTFVKDGNAGDLANLHLLFEIADYGPDYFPSSVEDKSLSSTSLFNSRRWSSPVKDFSKKLGSDKIILSSSGNESAYSQSTCTKTATVFSSKTTDGECNDLSISSTPAETNAGSSTSATEPVKNFSVDLNFRSDLYGLPRNELMRKVVEKTKVKPQGSSKSQANSDIQHHTNFDMKQLNILKDRSKLKVMKNSTKIKQRLLERDFDFEDFERRKGSADEMHSSYREGLDDEHYYHLEDDSDREK